MKSWFEKAKENAKIVGGVIQKKAEAGLEAAAVAYEQSNIESKLKEVASKAGKAIVEATDIKAVQEAVKDGVDAYIPPTKENLGLTYVTPNIIAMPLPQGVGKKAKTDPLRSLDRYSYYFEHTHKEHYMIWNLSEETYDYSFFNHNVMDFKFPGYPAPPLGYLFKICSSIENWISSDPKNVAVVHCMTGKGRTINAIGCYLAWMNKVNSPMEGMNVVCEAQGEELEEATIPSQRRYGQYFENMLEGIKPKSDVLLLKRVIINHIPLLDPSCKGVRPQLQIFKNGKMLYSSSWKDGETPEAVTVEEGSKLFVVDTPMHGDILLRCRHVEKDGSKRTSMFRTAFHTGYVQDNLLRLNKNLLDGACSMDEFHHDFFVELIFDSLDDPLGDSVTLSPGSHTPSSVGEREGSIDILEEDRDAFDKLLNSQSSFWEEVDRRKRTRGLKTASPARKPASNMKDAFSIGEIDAGSKKGPKISKQDSVDLTKAISTAGSDFLDEFAELEKSLGINRGGAASSDNDISDSISSELASFHEGLETSGSRSASHGDISAAISSQLASLSVSSEVPATTVTESRDPLLNLPVAPSAPAKESQAVTVTESVVAPPPSDPLPVSGSAATSVPPPETAPTTVTETVSDEIEKKLKSMGSFDMSALDDMIGDTTADTTAAGDGKSKSDDLSELDSYLSTLVLDGSEATSGSIDIDFESLGI